MVTARKRDESLQNVPVTVDAFTAADDPVGGHRIAARLRRDGAEHDPGRGAERRQLLHHHPRHLAGAQQRALGRGAGRWRAGDQSLRVRPGAVSTSRRSRCSRDRRARSMGAMPSAARSSFSTADLSDHFEGDGQARRRQRRCPRRPRSPSADRSTRPGRCSTAPRSISTIPTAIWRTPISTARPTRIGTTPGGCGCCGSPPINGARTCASTAIGSIPPPTTTSFRAPTRPIPFSSFTHAAECERCHQPDPEPITSAPTTATSRISRSSSISTSDYGTFTSVSDFNLTKEIDTGDAYDFRPIKDSIAYNYFFAGIPAADGGPAGESQSQFIDEKTESQELRFTSNKIERLLVDRGRLFRSHPALHLHRQSV